MKTKNIRLLVLTGAIVITGIVITQIYWVTKAFDAQNLQFNNAVQFSLSNAAKNSSGAFTETNQISPGYYVMNLTGIIDTNRLKQNLNNELAERNIKCDYEFGIFNSKNQNMIFSGGITKNGSAKIIYANQSDYYLGISFKGRAMQIAGDMYIWIFSSFVLLILISFFTYSVYVILKQKKYQEVQKDFVNNMTHEFRTPLTTISVTAETIEKIVAGNERTDLKVFSEILQSESRRLNENIERILQMSGSKITLNKQQLNLNSVIEETVHRFPAAIAGNIDIQLKLTSIPEIAGDEAHLSNVLMNLMDNACKYSIGKPNITITTSVENKHVKLTVTDKGIGIRKEHQEKIFERFFRIPTGNLHNVKGFGLGLNYVQNIIKAHRWKIKLFSEQSSGSSFSILIPK
jgi:two-component system, OmpR family, phosphate regulon sensor histidine kinase PhoR